MLGSPHLDSDGVAVEFGLRKAEALFYYLAITRCSHTRDSLAALFWPDDNQRDARANLRRALHRLHDKVGTGVIAVNRDAIGFGAEAAIWSDVVAFEAAVATAHSPAGSKTGMSPIEEQLENASAYYRGDLLTGFSLPNCPEFDEWLFFEQERFRRLLLGVHARLFERYEAQEEYHRAIPHLQHWLSLEPYDEQAHRNLIRCYALTGRRSAALRQFDECNRRFKDELGAELEAETLHLLDTIRTNRPTADSSPAAGEHNVHLLSPPKTKVGAAPHNLPALSTVIVGRTTELAEIRRLLTQEPGCRLLTLIGAGGIGKTRLALEIAHALLPVFGDGVCFVSLASLDDATLIAPAIAEAMRVNLQNRDHAREQLLRYCRDKEMLIVLDDFEHLIDGADFISQFLCAAPGVKVLVTSRERLHLHEEWIYDVLGLSYPPACDVVTAETTSAAIKYEAVQLFLKQAQRANVRLAPEAVEEFEAVARICRLVDGIPLALELAATWVRHMPPSVIAHELEKGLALLTTSERNVPERHRSMLAVFEETWRGLPDLERETLMRLSIFHGGCHREAAERVTGASLHQFVTLVDRSLLSVSKNGRYHLHSLLRQFALGQLQKSPATYEMTLARFCDYFGGFLEQCTDDLKGGRELAAIEEIAADMDNIRAAWRHAVRSSNLTFFQRSTETLWEYSEIRGGLHEGVELFERAAAVTADAGIREHALLGFLLAGQGWLRNRSGDLSAGCDLMEQGVNLLRRAYPRNRHFEATALMYYGFGLLTLGEYSEAIPVGFESLELVQKTGHRWSKALCLLLLGASAQLAGRLSEAEEYLKPCHRMSAEIGNIRLRMYANYNLINIAHAIGAYERSTELMHENLTAARDFSYPIVLSDTLGKRARTAIALGEYRSALEMLDESVKVLDSIGRSDAGIIRSYAGEALFHLGEFAAATQQLQDGLAATRAANHECYMAACLNGLGRVALAEGRRADAIRYHQEAFAIWQAKHNEPEIALTCYHLGLVLNQNSAVETMDYFRQALRIAVKHRLAPVAYGVFVALTPFLIEQGELAVAQHLLILASHSSGATYKTQIEAQALAVRLADDSTFSTLKTGEATEMSANWADVALWLLDHKKLIAEHTHLPAVPTVITCMDSSKLESEGILNTQHDVTNDPSSG